MNIRNLFLVAVLAGCGPPLLAENFSEPRINLKRVAEANKLLENEHPNFIYRQSKSKKSSGYIIGKEILRVTLTPDNKLRVVRVAIIFPAGTRQIKIGTELTVTSSEDCFAVKIGGGGVNTNLEITCAGAHESVLSGKDFIVSVKNGATLGKYRELIYIPYSDDLATSEIIAAGRAYLFGEIRKAVAELNLSKVHSRAFPDKLITEVFPEEILYRLSLIEHIDHDEFKNMGAEYCVNKVLTQAGLNREKVFSLAVSSTGALCLMQIMPSTYREVRLAYPKAKMNSSPVVGSCDTHVSAIKMAYLVLDSKLSEMPEDFKKLFLKSPSEYDFFLAAAYNGGASRARALYRKYPTGEVHGVLDKIFDLFRTRKGISSVSTMKPETWIFIKKYFEVSDLETP